MIWFSCKNCGKAHGCAENSAGTLVFCDCGQGVSVPWESTIAPPAQPAARAAPALPRLDPLPVAEVGRPATSPPVVIPAARRKTPPRRRDKRFCFNHEDRASLKSCAACTEGFCAECVIEFQGKTYCGPCKNFQIKLAQKPPVVTRRGIAALTVSLLAAPFAFCPLLFGGTVVALVPTALTIAPQIVSVLLGLLALRDTEQNPRIGGRSLAITALATALLFLTLAGFQVVTGLWLT